MVRTPKRLGEVDHRAHHRDRADRIDDVNAARRQRVFGGVRHEAMPPVAAVVGADDHLAQPPQLGLEDDPLLRAAADDAETPTPRRCRPCAIGMHHGGADAAADAKRAPRGDQFRGMAQRSGDVGNGLARFQRDQFLGALAYRLDDQRDGARPARPRPQ